MIHDRAYSESRDADSETVMIDNKINFAILRLSQSKSPTRQWHSVGDKASISLV